MTELEKTIKQLGEKFEGVVATPIIVGGWAVNLLGMARQTLDFDFMILEDDYLAVKKAFLDLGYKLVAKTPMFVRFESDNESLYPVYDCLFTDRSTYKKISVAGEIKDIFGTEFILPDPMHIIAMKLHALKFGTKERKSKDLGDIQALINIYSIDTKVNSDFEKLCMKFGTAEILEELRNG